MSRHGRQSGQGWRVKALAHLEMTRPYTMFHSGLLAIAGAELASHGAAPAVTGAQPPPYASSPAGDARNCSRRSRL